MFLRHIAGSSCSSEVRRSGCEGSRKVNIYLRQAPSMVHRRQASCLTPPVHSQGCLQSQSTTRDHETLPTISATLTTRTLHVHLRLLVFAVLLLGLPTLCRAGQDWPGSYSMARVYADVNQQMPRAYWDYDSVNISWGVLENYEVVRKIGARALRPADCGLQRHHELIPR